jgi:hypothetical protein
MYVCIILKYEDTPVWELPSKWNHSGEKTEKEKKKEISSSKDTWEKRKLLGLSYFNSAQRTVKENKTGPISGLPCW